jgi:hypothetical protein
MNERVTTEISWSIQVEAKLMISSFKLNLIFVKWVIKKIISIIKIVTLLFNNKF